jgi:threonine aldolase
MVDVAPAGRDAAEVVAQLRTHGIRASSRPPTVIRFVTHRQIDDEDVATLVETMIKLLT